MLQSQSEFKLFPEVLEKSETGRCGITVSCCPDKTTVAS
jgi:hypothetical protein